MLFIEKIEYIFFKHSQKCFLVLYIGDTMLFIEYFEYIFKQSQNFKIYYNSKIIFMEVIG